MKPRHTAYRTGATHAAVRRRTATYEANKARRDQALHDVHLALGHLRDVSVPEVEHELEVLVPARSRYVVGNSGTRFLGHLGLASFTISEYATGHDNHASNQGRLKVKEVVKGWFLPNILKAPAPYYRRLTVPSALITDSLIIAEDGRSWDSALAAHNTARTATTTATTDVGVLGVRDHGLYGDNVLEGLTEIHPNSTRQEVDTAVDRLVKVADWLIDTSIAAENM